MKRSFFGLMMLALMVALVWVGCSTDEGPSDRISAPTTEPAAKLTGLSRAMEVQNLHTNRLMGIPGIVGTATGLDVDGNPVVKVYAMRPGVAGVPEDLDGIPVRVEVTGMFVARSDPTARFPRPVPIGVSTGHPDITAGTIGCRVRDLSGNAYALSNNHVYANSNKAELGDNVLQPGPYDGGVDPADAIGTLAAFEPIQFNGPTNTIDAAIALSSTGDVGHATPADDGYGTPSTTPVQATLELPVQKFGRTTGWTHGIVSATNVTVDVCYKMAGPFRCKELARFEDQIAVTPGTFSGGGDSGSLIVTDDGNNNPVGLLFAGSDTHTLANPIEAVLQRFGVRIDDGSGLGNIPPDADFSFAATELEVAFTDQSSDSDGSIAAWAWVFGDGSSSALQNPTYVYTAAGTYTVSLSVEDDEGATDDISRDVTVSIGGSDISLTATGYKIKGRQKADLEWTGATSDSVEVYRDDALLFLTLNDDFETDNIDNVGGGSYTYKICEEGTATCSNEAVVSF